MDKSIPKKFLLATRVSDVTDALEALEQAATVAWRPVGNNDNNLAVIGLGSDPAAGVVERITNAIDAVLDQEWLQKGQPAHISSPRAAVEAWFGIKGGRLSSLSGQDLRKLEDLSSKVQVTLRDSDRPDKPTIDIRDEGTGLLAEEFADTILSLNKNRKLRKLFLAGAFGQGGSTALTYSLYTLIFSRKAVLSAKANPLAFAIVRFNPGDANVDKHGVYEYLVDRANGHPFAFDVPLDEFRTGTLVRHVAMDLAKYAAVMTAPTGSLWFLAHNYLFDPVMPFRIEEARSGKNAATRTVGGNNRLLTLAANTEYQRDANLTFKDGSVSVK